MSERRLNLTYPKRAGAVPACPLSSNAATWRTIQEAIDLSFEAISVGRNVEQIASILRALTE